LAAEGAPITTDLRPSSTQLPDHQRLAAGLHGRHQVDGPAAKTAIGLGHRDRGQAHLGKGRPDRLAHTAVGLHDDLALFEVVFIAEILAQ